jgi:hypothetical protein
VRSVARAFAASRRWERLERVSIKSIASIGKSLGWWLEYLGKISALIKMVTYYRYAASGYRQRLRQDAALKIAALGQGRLQRRGR